MLNLGFGEILIFSLLALVVVGPERLPTMVRFMGRQYGKLLRASRELRRAFYMEAERVESEVRRAKLKKSREEAMQRQKEMIQQHTQQQTQSQAIEDKTDPPQGISQDQFVPFDHEPHTPTPDNDAPKE